MKNNIIYIFDKAHTLTSAVRGIEKTLVKQKRFNGKVIFCAAAFLIHTIALEKYIFEQNKAITKLIDEIEELKRAEGV